MPAIAVIGGSGLYALGNNITTDDPVVTPFGPTSAPIVHSTISGVEVVFMARHGVNHTLSPSEVPSRANIWALKKLGVKWLISVSAVGSLKKDLEPTNVVVVDQYIDRTKSRPSTFFEGGIVAHIAFGDPTCAIMREHILSACQQHKLTVQNKGTYVCMEGPAFSTRAESNFYRQLGADVIGMTAIPEAKLAREAEIAYATIAMVTDFDCWHPDHDMVTVDQVIETLHKNADAAGKLLETLVPLLAQETRQSAAHTALDTALLTPKESISTDGMDRLEVILRRRLA